MSMSDPIADLLTRIRNAAAAGHGNFVAPSSKAKEAVLAVLQSEGYIRGFKTTPTETNQNEVRVELKYLDGRPVFSEIKRVSKPGRRVYSSCKDMPKVHGGLGVYVISTSKGVMPDYEARLQNIGGEIICRVF
ncbi:MAG: 30S ribosomal protein S8 [Alphaproteobacteria bacterium]|nr:30S ribosomal protein S8 [Alphaproteobacteria bacterium]